MFSKVWSSFSKKNQSIQNFYTQYKTAFTVVTTLIGTSAAWASYFARQKHNQKEQDIKAINKSIAQIPEKTNLLYDRMDMIIVGGSALVIGYVTCVVKHKTVNFYRYWNAQKAASLASKKTELIQGEAIAKELVTKDEIRTLEKSNHNILRYYFQSSKQEVRHFFSTVGSKCYQCIVKMFMLGKAFIVKNKALYEWVIRFSTSVSSSVHRITDKVSVKYHEVMYKHNLHVIQKKQVKAMMDGEKEVINKGNMSSVISQQGESK